MRKFALLGLVVVFGWSPGAWGIPANNSNTLGLVAAYEFTGNADDLSGNGNDGSVSGATLTADRFGNANSAYAFDGNSAIILPSFENQLLSGFSFSAWVYQTSVGGWSPVIVKSNPSGATPIHFSLGAFGNEETNENNNMSLYISSDGSIVERAYRYSDQVPDIGAWIHIAGVYDPGTRQDLFINGAISTGPLEGTIQNSYLENSQPFRIGKVAFESGYGGDPGFQGVIDEVYIYNRALSAAEVLTLATIPEPSTALLLGVGLAGLGMRRRTRTP